MNKDTRKIYFTADSFISKQIEYLVEHCNINRSNFFRNALKDYFQTYEFGENWYDEIQLNLSKRVYGFCITKDIAKKLSDMKSHNLNFNLSQVCRKAVLQRIYNFVQEEAVDKSNR